MRNTKEVKAITKSWGSTSTQNASFLLQLAGGGMERSNTKYYSQCRCVTYCSRECQKARWTNHKSYCERDAALIAIFHKPDFDANAVM